MTVQPIIDACVHHHWASQEDVMAYMSRGWQEYLNQPKVIPGVNEPPMPIVPMVPYHRPDGDMLPDSAPPGGPPGSSLELLREQHLDRHGIERAVLAHDVAMYTPLTPNPHLAREISRAANDWTIDRWLSEDERLYGLVLVPNQTPDEAAAEIARVGSHPRMAGVLMAANGLNRAFGHPAYHPIYRAAAEWDLPIVLHSGGDAPKEAITHPTAGGLPTSYGVYHVLRPQALMTHITSIVAQGVMEKFPTLRILIAGGGVAWLPSLFWRFDYEYNAYRRETPWVKRTPSEYLRERIRIATHPLDVASTPGGLARLLEIYGGCEDLLVYAGGYPHWDYDTPAHVAETFPDDWRERILYRNALGLFRWDAPAAPQPIAPVDAVGAMD